MAVCDVCGSTSLLPEKFGEVNVCKICFMKASGPLWKRQYDRYEDAENHRRKALDSAYKQNFPQRAGLAINDYFMEQINSMQSCDCCGHPVKYREPIGFANICKQCYNKINNSAWKTTEYEDNDDVEKNRKKILTIASRNSFPPIVIDGINRHFDSKIQKGLLYSIDGGTGQKLKVFTDHCILNTVEGFFDPEELSVSYAKALKMDQPKKKLVSNSAAKSLAKGVLSGNIVKAGIKFATAVAIDAATEDNTPKKVRFKVNYGDFKINYQTYNYVEYQEAEDNNIGYIRFVNSKTGGRQTDDILFFFKYDEDKIDKAYDAICEAIDRSSQLTTQETLYPTQQIPPAQFAPASVSVADEILKFKQLFDMGIITHDEFELKKRELLSGQTAYSSNVPAAPVVSPSAPAHSAMVSIFCSQCGTKNSDTACFCCNCGYPFSRKLI